MALRRFQPISPSAQWSDTLAWRDPRTGQLNSLDGAVITMALYQARQGAGRGCGDYGWFRGGRDGVPVVAAQTQADGSGPFVILPDRLHVQFTFPAGALWRLCAGEAELIAWANVGGVIDEIERVTIPVLVGPRFVPFSSPQAVPPSPPTDDGTY